MAEQAYEPRLKAEYRERIRAKMRERFGYTNEMQIPKLDKIVINMGVGEAVGDSKKIQTAMADLTRIAGQKPVATKARTSIAGSPRATIRSRGTAVTVGRWTRSRLSPGGARRAPRCSTRAMAPTHALALVQWTISSTAGERQKGARRACDRGRCASATV